MSTIVGRVLKSAPLSREHIYIYMCQYRICYLNHCKEYLGIRAITWATYGCATIGILVVSTMVGRI